MVLFRGSGCFAVSGRWLLSASGKGNPQHRGGVPGGGFFFFKYLVDYVSLHCKVWRIEKSV